VATKKIESSNVQFKELQGEIWHCMDGVGCTDLGQMNKASRLPLCRPSGLHYPRTNDIVPVICGVSFTL